MDKKKKNIMFRGNGLREKYMVRQKNSKEFVIFMRNLFPNMPMGMATQKLSDDLWRAITKGEDIGKRYKRMLNGKK